MKKIFVVAILVLVLALVIVRDDQVAEHTLFPIASCAK